MTNIRRATEAQWRKAYREAVQSVLVAFYRVPERRATDLVDSWWDRLKALQAFQSGIFMHDEPMTTAADLAKLPVIPIDSSNRDDYEKLLQRFEPQPPRRSKHAEAPSNRPKHVREVGGENGRQRQSGSATPLVASR